MPAKAGMLLNQRKQQQQGQQHYPGCHLISSRITRIDRREDSNIPQGHQQQ
jgi:hypothetical protein